ncbi:hypothetical protein C8Q77DRAFT_246530 [Trametes polyzona]|nr:hypothetical protein C8Q77DRAFT_246530 [Trametes polyzona]
MLCRQVTDPTCTGAIPRLVRCRLRCLTPGVRRSRQSLGFRTITRTSASLGWAQDGLWRNVAVKITLTDSDEYRVYQALLQPTVPQSNTQCLGVLRPLAILDTSRRFSFIVLPRWGNTGLHWLKTVGEVMQFIRCTSRGLRLLHENRIIHRLRTY